MSQITIGGTTLNFKDSAFTGDQWEQVASWVLNGGAEGIDANAQIATEKAAAASASAAAARNSATSAGESATAAANSATAAKAREDAAQSWAVGGTGTREGEDTNNAKYWAEQAQQSVGGVASFNGRAGSVVPQAGDYDKGMVGLGNVDNTSDVNKPVSKKQQAALNGKQAKITASGLLKGDGAGGVSAAVKGTDYAAPSVGVSVTLTASGWNANAKTQTVSVAGVTATANCIITAAPDSYMAYAEAGVRCTAQGAGTLTFACETVPTADVASNVLILG